MLTKLRVQTPLWDQVWRQVGSPVALQLSAPMKDILSADQNQF